MVRFITLVSAVGIAYLLGIPAIPASILIIVSYVGGLIRGNQIKKETML